MKKPITATLFAAALGLAALAPARAADNLTMADFGHSIKLMVDGYTGDETLENFPVLVRVSEAGIPGFHYDDMSAKNASGKTYGYDLAFFAEDGTRLPCEIDTWSHSAGVNTSTQLVWVAVSRLAQGTKFWMCYNVDDGVMVENPNPWGDYVGVWHLGESGGQNKPVFDSTVNGLVGTNFSSSGSSVSSGAIGKARKISNDNAHDKGIIVNVLTDPAKKAAAESLGTDFHASFWMVAGDGGKDYVNLKWGNLLGRRKGDQGKSWGFAFHGDNDVTKVNYMRVFSGSTTVKWTTNPIGAVLKLNDGIWKKVDVVWKYASNNNTPVADVYTNGVFVETVALNEAVKQEDANIGIGCSTQDTYGSSNSSQKGRRFNGSMDEVRLRPGVLAAAQMADWIKADFDTVNNASFVTVAPPEVTWANASGDAPGVADVAFDSVGFAGEVDDCGGFASCSIQCKVWAADGGEPDEWTTITNGLVAGDAFSVVVPGLLSETAYRYALRASGDGDAASESVSGTFTTLAGLTVSWSSATAAAGLSTISYDRVSVGGSVVSVADGTTCEILAKIWPADGTEPADWTVLASGLASGDAFEVAVPNLAAATSYRYSLYAEATDGESTSPVSGTFETAPDLTVAWAETAGMPGITRVSYDFATVSGQVEALGGSASCAVQAKIWASGDAEPAGWTTLSEGLVLTDAFSVSHSGLLPGTPYAYKLRALGTDGTATEPVTGAFTTKGEPGEETGSDYTHFFDDGTNACWVANEFERYLPFTVTGYTGSETLTNFPVLVDVRAKDDNGFSYSDFYHLDGRDMAFVDERGRLIPHEIDTWNYGGMSLIWVRLPEMNNGTTFTMCYRSPLVDPPPSAGNAFERYVGVWHMNETADGVVDIADSTTNNLVGETHALSLASGNNGRIGGARRVAQQSGSSMNFGRILVFDHDDILRTGVGNVFTYSGWYKFADEKPGWAYLVSRKAQDTDKGWGVQTHDSNSTTLLRVWSDPTGANWPSGSAEKNHYQTFALNGYGKHSEWAYWTFVFSNQTFHAFLNGTELDSTVGGFALNEPVANDETAAYDNLVIGGMQTGTGALNGLVDEARYSRGVRSDDWIKAEYDSTLQVDKPFVTKGTQIGRGPESLVPVIVWRTGKGMPETILDVSYAYVQFAGTVTYCGSGATECRVEYRLWADGEEEPEDWTPLVDHAQAGDAFSVPVYGLKQDMPYRFRLRAVNEVDGVQRSNREHAGSFRTNGNVQTGDVDGELFRVGNLFVHRFRKGSWTFTTPDYVTNVSIMVVGGGGAGGYKIGGGGGGGGVFFSESFPVATNTDYVVSVGAGGTAATDLTARSEDGEWSAFALASDDAHPLVAVPGGGAGGSYADTAAAGLWNGSDGASGGGGTHAQAGGEPVEDGAYGHAGGAGNNKLSSGADGAWAAGGGGGAGRAGLVASSDSWYGGGSGGVGIGWDVTGEMLYFGAGGGGGYGYKEDDANFTKPGAGGSGIGGNAANVRDGTPATSGVENTGAGGGGGSMDRRSPSDTTYWQGGDGGDGVVLISYEVHGRDPISDDPRITMTRCDHDPDAGTTGTGVADIGYRAYWAGIQADLDDVYVLYSTVSEEDVAAGNGEWAKVGENLVGIGDVTFVPPEVGHTYWVRLVARKDANSFMYSDEIASFYVPAVTLKAATWKKQNSSSDDYALVDYTLHDLDESTHLYCYWSESRESLEGDDPPSGEGVRLLDLGTGMAGSTTFSLPASEGLSRNHLYYVRLAAGDAKGLRHNLSQDILPLDTSDTPAVALLGHAWADSVATLQFRTTLSFLDPADTTLFAYYSTVKNDVTRGQTTNSTAVTFVNLGLCSSIPDEKDTTASFPLWATEATNYYVRLVLYSAANNKWYQSGSTREIAVTTPIAANTLLIVASTNPKIGCYGDAPQALDYAVSYGGLVEGPGWEHRPSVVGEPACAVSATSKPGQYDITQGTVALSSAEPWIETETDPDTGEVTQTTYQYQLVFAGAKYAVTNAVFSADVEDLEFDYTGESFTASELTHAEAGVRNGQTVTYSFREGSGEWTAAPPASYVDAGTYTVQFKASAPNHDSAYGTFQVVVKPAPLTATIADATLAYTGEAQAPVVATNVTGLVRGDLNALSCSFRDGAGAWQETVPTFTDPGEYRLFFRAEAPNHETAVASCTVTVEGWDYRVNLDGQTGYPTPIHVSDPGWLLRTTGWTSERFAVPADRYAKLDEVQANGLTLWQNYVIDRSDLGKRLVAAVRQSGDRVDANAFVVHFPNVDVLANTGLDVSYRLDRKLRGETEFTLGEPSDKYEMNVPLGPGDPTGLYVFNIVLTPTNGLLSGQSVLASCATVGVLRVSSLATNTVTAAPWMSMDSAEAANEPVTVAETVNPNGLTAETTAKDGAAANDQILVYDAPADTFRTWAYESGTTWRSITTVTKAGLSATDADTNHLARGTAFWLVRQAPSQYFYLVGRYTGDDYAFDLAGATDDADETKPGYTLVANPTMYDVSLNSLTFVDGSGDPATPAADDRIVVQDKTGIDKIYVRNGANTEWGRYVSRKVNGRIRQTWESGGTVPSGTGFWYVRTAEDALSIRFEGAE